MYTFFQNFRSKKMKMKSYDNDKLDSESKKLYKILLSEMYSSISSFPYNSHLQDPYRQSMEIYKSLIFNDRDEISVKEILDLLEKKNMCKSVKDVIDTLNEIVINANMKGHFPYEIEINDKSLKVRKM